MTRINKTALEDSRKTVVRALPVEKDFGAILNAISVSSARAGVSVDDYAFGIGPISSSSADKIKNASGLDTTSLSISLQGSIDGVLVFIKELQEKMPLSEVESIETSQATTTIALLFYSKHYKAMNIADDQPINPISAVNGQMINTLTKWQIQSGAGSDEVPQRSSSVPLF